MSKVILIILDPKPDPCVRRGESQFSLLLAAEHDIVQHVRINALKYSHCYQLQKIYQVSFLRVRKYVQEVKSTNGIVYFV